MKEWILRKSFNIIYKETLKHMRVHEFEMSKTKVTRKPTLVFEHSELKVHGYDRKLHVVYVNLNMPLMQAMREMAHEIVKSVQPDLLLMIDDMSETNHWLKKTTYQQHVVVDGIFSPLTAFDDTEKNVKKKLDNLYLRYRNCKTIQ